MFMDYGFLHEVSILGYFIEFISPEVPDDAMDDTHTQKMNVFSDLCGILIAINTVATVSGESKIYEVGEQSN